MKFHWIDILVVLVVLRGVYLGHRRGLSGEFLRFLGIICAFALALRFYTPVTDRLPSTLPGGRNTAIALGFSGVFLAVFAFFYMVNQTVRHLAQLPVIGAIEKTGGAVLGGAKAFLLCCAALILLALVKVDRISNAVSRNSFFGPMAISGVPGAYRLAVRVYPPAKGIPAGDVIENLPAVQMNISTEEIGSTGPVRGDKAASGGAPSGASPAAQKRKVR